jgi:hypothetical protein
MSKTIPRIALSLLLGASLVIMAQQLPSEWTTSGELNGRGWKALNDRERTLYLRGVADGISNTGSLDAYLEWMPQGDFRDIEKAINEEYATPLGVKGGDAGDVVPLIQKLRMIRKKQDAARGAKPVR